MMLPTGRPGKTYKHRSSTTLMTDRMPLWFSFGVGAPAREPSPKNVAESSVFDLVDYQPSPGPELAANPVSREIELTVVLLL